MKKTASPRKYVIRWDKNNNSLKKSKNYPHELDFSPKGESFIFDDDGDAYVTMIGLDNDSNYEYYVDEAKPEEIKRGVKAVSKTKKKIANEIRALEQKIAGNVDYDTYMKQHPKSKKTRNDPMFAQPQKQAPAQQAPAQQAPAQQAPAQQAPAPAKPATKKSVSDFSDQELDELGFIPAHRNDYTDEEVLEELKAKQEYEKLLRSGKAEDIKDEAYSSYMRRYKEDAKSRKSPDFEPGDYYTAIRKHIGDNADSLTRKGIREAIRIYHPQARLTNDQVDRIMEMYEKKNNWG